MPGALAGLKVLDLSSGIAGPMATMLLADNGAEVTRIEPPGGDPSRALSGARVWHRGKRSAVLDLHDEGDRAVFLRLAAGADVVVESFAPGTAERLGIGHERLLAANPALVHCSITGYGDLSRHAGRPAYDALVGARTGELWETRGAIGTTLSVLSGRPDPLAGAALDPSMWIGPPGDGPLLSGVPWPSVGAAYLAALAISGGLRARECTGRGQHVSTTLLQGVLAATGMAWQRVERPRPGYVSWVADPRAPKSFFRCSDGRWVHHWLPVPAVVLPLADGGAPCEGSENPRAIRIPTDIEAIPQLQGVLPAMAEAFAKHPSDEWVRRAAGANLAVQTVRSPEEGLLDPLFLAAGAVVEVDDPEVGPVRMLGPAYTLHACPGGVGGPAPTVGRDTEAVRAEAAVAPVAPVRAPSGDRPGPGPALARGPLDGVLVLDLGLAVAGPFGAQLLGALGADVVKVTSPREDWLDMQFGMMCNRGKRSIVVDLKHPDGRHVFEQLVARADVVHLNWRQEAATKLGVDFETLRRIRPDLIFCHTHGFEPGPRRAAPGNDQMAGALAGTEWLDGGLDHGGEPVWPNHSIGDTGNGLLSAIAVVQALLHRDRTGEGGVVETSIVNAHLFNASMAWASPDGSRRGDRPMLDAGLRGWNALYRVYECADATWLVLAAVTDAHRDALRSAGVVPGGDEAWGDDAALQAALASAFASDTADTWATRLDAAGVPSETAPLENVVALFDDPEMRERGWIAAFEHPTAGHMEMAGRLVDFAATPGSVLGPAPTYAQHTVEVLRELGYGDDAIEGLRASGAVAWR